MTRLRDWQSRLSALLRERQSMPFAWGSNDCCTFACDAVLAMTGQDPAEGLRDHQDAREATETLRAHGGVRELGDARLGEPILPALGQVGDIGLVNAENRISLVVCVGEAWVGPGIAGLVRMPASAVLNAWRT
jgi:hypothetical protein